MNNSKKFCQNPLFLRDESGQILPFSFGLILLCLIFGLYFFYEAEFFEEYAEDLQQTREDLFEKTYKLSSILNELAFNNKNIISSLSLAIHGLSHAVESGADLADSCPYWEAPNEYYPNKIKHPPQFNISTLKDQDPTGESKIMKDIEEVLHSIELRVSRGLFLAHLFHKKNELIIKNLPNHLASFFSFMSKKEVLCLVLKTNEALLSSRIIKIPSQSKWIKINDCDFILNKNSKISISPPSEEFGPFLVRTSREGNLIVRKFLNHLILTEDVSYQQKDEFRNFLRMVIQYLSPTSEKRIRTGVQSRVIHPRILCIGERKKGVLIEKHDFELCHDYHLKKFQTAFFDPRWTPIIDETKKW